MKNFYLFFFNFLSFLLFPFPPPPPPPPTLLFLSPWFSNNCKKFFRIFIRKPKINYFVSRRRTKNREGGGKSFLKFLTWNRDKILKYKKQKKQKTKLLRKRFRSILFALLIGIQVVVKNLFSNWIINKRQFTPTIFLYWWTIDKEYITSRFATVTFLLNINQSILLEIA